MKLGNKKTKSLEKCSKRTSVKRLKQSSIFITTWLSSVQNSLKDSSVFLRQDWQSSYNFGRSKAQKT